jgi:hypothetical protein
MYCYASNNPVDFVDVDGLGIDIGGIFDGIKSLFSKAGELGCPSNVGGQSGGGSGSAGGSFLGEVGKYAGPAASIGFAIYDEVQFLNGLKALQENVANYVGQWAANEGGGEGPVITKENGGITWTGKRDTDTDGKNNSNIKDIYKVGRTSLKDGGPSLNGLDDYSRVFSNAKGEDYDPTETSYGTITPKMQINYGVKFGDVGYAQNTLQPKFITKFIIADGSPQKKYAQEGSQKGNIDLGLKNASGNIGFDKPIIKVHIFVGSVKYFTDKTLCNGKFYTNGHLPSQSQINNLVDYLMSVYKISL